MRRFVAAAAVSAVFLCAFAQYVPPTVDGTTYLLAHFNSPESERQFVRSDDEKYAGQSVSLVQHADEGAIDGDQSLRLNVAAKHYGLTAPFDGALEFPADKEFVLQYEVALTEGLDCGGAYLKVLRHEDGFTPEGLTPNSPYAVMFGPDKCGGTNKVHFILQRQNAVSGEWEEKHLNGAPTIKADALPHVYTLTIKPDNTYAVHVDTVEVKAGSLFEDFEPPVNPPEEINDPSDEKPLDWVDEATIPDPEASKPDDWDEDAPVTIPDDDATMPDGWLEDAPEFVADPEAEQPEDWDDDEDGEWEAPMVPNPDCETAPGCGEWVRPSKPNPAYKGKWSAPMIDNPEYEGEWAPRRIPNPNYFVDEQPHQLPTMSGVAIEIWTMSGGIEFDNVLVTDSQQAALEFAGATWKVKHEGMDALVKESRREADKTRRLQAYENGTLLDKLQFFVFEGLDVASQNPVAAVATAAVLVVSMLWCCVMGSGKQESPIVGSDDEEEEDDEGDADTASDADDADAGNASEEEEEEEEDDVE